MKNALLVKKLLSMKEAQNYSEISTSQQFLLLANPEEYFYLMERNPFVQTIEIGKKLTKKGPYSKGATYI